MGKIVQNTAYLTTAFVLQKILAFIYFTLIARIIGVENIGIYAFALSYTTIFSIFIDLGFSPVLVRETAKNKEGAQGLLNNILGIKLILGFLTLVAVGVSITFLESSGLSRIMVYLAGVVMVMDSFTLTFWSIFRGFQNLKYEAISVVIMQGIIVAIGITGITMGFDIYVLMIALILGSFFHMGFSFISLKRKLGLKIHPQFDTKLIKRILVMAIPFALLGIFTKWFMSVDSVMIKFLGKDSGEKYLGWYSVPYKINFALHFIPGAFAAAIFPAMSKYFVSSKEALTRTFERSMHFLMIIAFPASVGIFVLADVIILKLFGTEFSQSIMTLRIMILSLVFVFLGYPVGSLLNASNYQTKNTINVGIALLFSIILNLILIPRYFHLGAGITAAISNTLLLFLGLYYCGRIIKYSKIFLLKSFFKTFLSAVIMGINVWALKITFGQGEGMLVSVFNLVALPIFGVLIYFVALYLLNGFSKEDTMDIFDAFVRKRKEKV